MELLSNCHLCPRNCGVNRLIGEKGFCGAGKDVKIARVSLHYFEEPCISGKNGSGTVFFSNCSLRCVFCQNHKISQSTIGKEISIDRLSDIFLELQNKNAHNINLVTPTHYAVQIKEAIEKAKSKGLNIPIVYNSSGYETTSTIKLLKNSIDVYIPDFKYFNNKYALKYSSAPNYFNYAKESINEMISQVGEAKFNEEGLITKGVIIRHMMLPGLLFDSKKIIDYISKNFGDIVYLSIMNQYTPMHNASEYAEINKTLNPKHYDALISYALNKGITKGFIQEEGTSSEEFVPEFDLRGV